MTSACDHCAKTVKSDDDFIECMGFCKNVVHMQCDKQLNKPFLKKLAENPNLFWMCNECVKLMKFARFRDTVSSLGCVIAAIAGKTDDVCAELKAELSKNNQQISHLARKVSTATPVRPNSGTSRPPQKRRREDGPDPSSILVGGRKLVDNSNILTVPPPIPLLWMYLSRFHPSVSKETVEKMSKEGLNCNEEIKVIPLVKKGIDVSTLNFISFKVGVHPKYREAALNPDTWPQGILFREFEDSRTQNIWCPPTDFPTPSEVACIPLSQPGPSTLQRTPQRLAMPLYQATPPL
ncbi:uncharacterized protein LOC131693870 [Topomyia yanbarensis]|uniref:uncharacterized protein LOC131693870 n=1 Tax=Topomyia yanbarensis TaxID=2498891 RepID=UPI00273B37E1|nr:uncharacterized protein LOC131693870 [Topomyia yanbarensis]